MQHRRTATSVPSWAAWSRVCSLVHPFEHIFEVVESSSISGAELGAMARLATFVAVAHQPGLRKESKIALSADAYAMQLCARHWGRSRALREMHWGGPAAAARAKGSGRPAGRSRSGRPRGGLAELLGRARAHHRPPAYPQTYRQGRVGRCPGWRPGGTAELARLDHQRRVVTTLLKRPLILSESGRGGRRRARTCSAPPRRG